MNKLGLRRWTTSLTAYTVELGSKQPRTITVSLLLLAACFLFSCLSLSLWLPPQWYSLGALGALVLLFGF